MDLILVAAEARAEGWSSLYCKVTMHQTQSCKVKSGAEQLIWTAELAARFKMLWALKLKTVSSAKLRRQNVSAATQVLFVLRAQ